MEMEAHYRDQTHWACAAQDSKLLPKRQNGKKVAGQKVKALVSPVFEAYYKKYGRPEDKKGAVANGKPEGEQ